MAVLWRLRYKLGFRGVAELLLQRGYAVTHETIRDWELRYFSGHQFARHVEAELDRGRHQTCGICAATRSLSACARPTSCSGTGTAIIVGAVPRLARHRGRACTSLSSAVLLLASLTRTCHSARSGGGPSPQLLRTLGQPRSSWPRWRLILRHCLSSHGTESDGGGRGRGKLHQAGPTRLSYASDRGRTGCSCPTRSRRSNEAVSDSDRDGQHFLIAQSSCSTASRSPPRAPSAPRRWWRQ